MSNYQIGMDVLPILKNKTAPLAKERQSQSNFNTLEILFPVLLLGGTGLMMFV